MKKSIVCIFGFILSVLFISNAAAEPASLTWKGDYTHGMYEGMRLTGSCLFDLEGDPFKQEAICKLRYFDPASAKRKVFKMTDPEAKIEVVGDGYVVRLTMGVSVPPTGNKGNFKAIYFQMLLTYGQQVQLNGGQTVVIGGLRRYETATLTLGGFIATATQAQSEPPDCILFDILGSGVHE